MTSNPDSPKALATPSEYGVVDNTGSYMTSALDPVRTQIAIDCAAMSLAHVKTDKNGRPAEIVKGSLNDRLMESPNPDQYPSLFIQDLVEMMLVRGHVAILPISAKVATLSGTPVEIYDLRVGYISDWFVDHVDIIAYNPVNGSYSVYRKVPKTRVAIVMNPLGRVMNDSNLTLKRLLVKQSQLDDSDRKNAGSQGDIVLRTTTPMGTATGDDKSKRRVNAITNQLDQGDHGVFLIGPSEDIIQLNRPVQSHLPAQVESLTTRLYAQLGLSEAVFSGSATDNEMSNYRMRTIYPIMDAVAQSITMKFLTKSARTRGHRVIHRREIMRAGTITELDSLVDTLTRNAIYTPNEVRAGLGDFVHPDKDADKLRNRNLNLDANEKVEERKVTEEEDVNDN